MKQPIGILDSGVGGLTVVKEAMRQLPHESLIYIGDNARCPYGPRTNKEILTYTTQLVDYLLKFNIKMLVIACNTATAVTAKVLQERLDIPVIGVIKPGALAANRKTVSGKVGLIATETTVRSHFYEHFLWQKNAHLEVTSLACPSFVNLVESHEYHSPLAKQVVKKQLQPMIDQQVDTLILGCTHFPIISDIIQITMGDGVTLIDSGKETISEVSYILSYENIEASNEENDTSYQFFTTGSAQMFDEIAAEWLEKPITTKHVSLNELEGDE